MSRVAIIIVHGIGKQGRYQTLDKFVRGFSTALPERDLACDASPITLAGGGSHSFVSIMATDGAPLMANPAADAVDCYEAYWQSQVRGVARVRGVALWLANTAMAPLRRWAQSDVHQRSVPDRFRLILLEFARLLTVPFAVLITGIGIVAANGKWGGVRDVDVGALPAFAAVAEIVGLLAIFLMVRGGIWKGLLRSKVVRNIDRKMGASRSESWWGWASVFFVGLILTAFAVSISSAQSPYLLSEEIRPFVVSVSLACVVWRGSSLLTDIVGDAAIYLTDDPDSKGSQTRSEIRAAVQNLVADLACSGKYDQLHIVAHSLGTVISYDMLNKLRMLAEGAVYTEMASSDQLQEARRAKIAYSKIGTLVTLASPLDFVAHYFRTRVPSDRSVRREILHFRHGLRVRPDGDGPYLPGPPQLYWLNIHARGDVIGEHLKIYSTDHQRRVGTWTGTFRPVTAHEGMWKSEPVYRIIADRLAFRTRDEAVAAVAAVPSTGGRANGSGVLLGGSEDLYADGSRNHA